MLTYLKECGPTGPILLIITILNIVLVIRSVVKIAGATREQDARISNGINAVLFWGLFAAVLGFLGQYTGIYNALGALARATEISPTIVMQGLRESFTTTLWGLNLLLWSALAWAALQTWHRRSSAGMKQTLPSG